MDVRTSIYYLTYPFRKISESQKRRSQRTAAEISKKRLRKLWMTHEKSSSSCPICGNDRFSKVADEDRHGIGITTVLCERCGFGLMNPQPSVEFYRKFYQEYYWDLYFGRGANHENHLKYWRSQSDTLVGSLISAGLDLENRTVFEIGCGPGYTLESIRSHWNCRVSALEPSVEEATRVRDLFPDSLIINSTVEEVGELPSFLQGKCDFVISTHVFEHVCDLLKAFELVQRSVSPNGLVYIEVPDFDYDGWKFPHIFHIAHLWHFDEETLTCIAARFGLRKTQVFRGANRCIKRSGVGVLFEVGESLEVVPDRLEANQRRIEKIKRGS